ncbi:DUF4352 domain-containing protein [Flavobacterium psychrophilum]|uniref:DUF4352 domain-containing protein n=1 Tax=Flavobacterium psychrophilum TaxID=96345 RepID=UPI000A3AAC78|nr:DUF4352 domain-containing protein [Flavobacterium psychrophilum]ELI6456122.1 DUF4352 domain-containing protein [Flavobacterium psychrophilum]ELM3645242.1 DUF4352 domain-containing protein [Flavobacterium psychrophilum]OUD24866.1 hypothetical protein FPG92_12480 [Flavobacterium psychrophilum]
MEQKPKMAIWKKVLIGIAGTFTVLLILSKLFPINYYETGIDYYNKKNYKEALENFNNVETSDKNYKDAILKINEIKPIVDSINKVEEIEKEKKEIEKEKNSSEDKQEKVEVKETEKKSSENNNSIETAKDEGLRGTVGQSYDVGSLTYKVERVKFKKFIGGLYTLNKADGVFVIITLTVTNKSHKEINIDNSYFKLTDESGAEYGYSPDGTASLELSEFPGETFMGMSLNPNVAKKGKVVFEVPTKKKDYKLVFTDPFSGTFLEIDMN